MVITVPSAPAETAEDSYPVLDVRVSNIKSTIEFLTAIQPVRNYTNLPSLNRAADFIKERFAAYGLVTEVQSYKVYNQTYTNIIGTIGQNRAPRIIVGAHYDVFDNQPGADDNASGIAGLLEAARIIKQQSLGTGYRIDFVAYPLEEPPFFGTEDMGSYVHARSLHEAGVEVRGMIGLEMIGYFTDAEKSQEYPVGIMKLFYPSRGNFIAVVGNFSSSGLTKEVKKRMQSAEIDVCSLTAPSWIPGVDFSDHRNYWKFGYDAVMITDTAFYRNPHYHEVSDTMETLDFSKIQEVVKGLVWALINMK